MMHTETDIWTERLCIADELKNNYVHKTNILD